MTIKLLRALGAFFGTLLIYLGTILLGWSLPDLTRQVPGFFDHAPRLAYGLGVVLFGLLVGGQAYRSMEGIQDSQGLAATRVRRQTVVAALLMISLYAAMFLLPFTRQRGFGVFAENHGLEWIGVLLCLLGYGLIFWSGLALGRQYSAEVVIQKDHELVTSGPYRLVRHPRYLGILCMSLGLSLLFDTWLGLAFCLIVIGLLLARIYDEEALLEKTFGERWRQYCRHSWRLVPLVY